MNSSGSEGWIVAFIFVIGIILGVVFGINVDSKYSKTHTSIIKHGCMQYDNKSGDPIWIDELKAKDSIKVCK